MKTKKDLCGVTVPTEVGFVDETLKILEKWGADAVRDCDGTDMPDEIKRAGYKVYSTYFVARGDNKWAKAHPDECTHFYLMTDHAEATQKALSIDITKGYLTEQVVPDYDYDPKIWWEVIDRTTGKVVSPADWHVDKAQNIVIIDKVLMFHEYTVSYLAKAIWDSTQMYNYITNNWTKDKDLPFDVRYEETYNHMLERMEIWLKEHPDTTVVRFTTFFYHFSLVFNDKRKEKFVDWFGYSGSVSPKAIEDFEKEYGYRLRPEDIVDGGYYNSPFRVPSKAFLDYMDFTQRYVAKAAKALVEIVHKHGREAMMFLGDNWIGTEPYGKYFGNIGLDAVVGSVGGGVTIRMLSEIPHVKYTEGRFLPYFFPDTFREGGEPTKELNKNWLTARRAIMRKPVDRIGYGGYLSLAAKFPDFVERVSEICDEFKKIYEVLKGAKPYSGVKVGILNAWGKIRSWQCYMVAHELWYKQIYSYQGILEALSGMSVDVEFISFDDVKNGNVPKDIDVILNAGDAMTAFSGGDWWLDEEFVCKIRKWIYGGGAFIGIGEPSAVHSGGKYFQLSNALGVDKELGFTLSTDKYNTNIVAEHFIKQDISEPICYGEEVNNIYARQGTEVLDMQNGNVTMAVNSYGKGRCFYMAGMKYSMQNTRILERAMYYVSHKEAEFYRYKSSNILTECNYYPDKSLVALLNNSSIEQKTIYTNGDGEKIELTLAPMEIRWIKV